MKPILLCLLLLTDFLWLQRVGRSTGVDAQASHFRTALRSDQEEDGSNARSGEGEGEEEGKVGRGDKRRPQRPPRNNVTIYGRIMCAQLQASPQLRRANDLRRNQNNVVNGNHEGGGGGRSKRFSQLDVLYGAHGYEPAHAGPESNKPSATFRGDFDSQEDWQSGGESGQDRDGGHSSSEERWRGIVEQQHNELIPKPLYQNHQRQGSHLGWEESPQLPHEHQQHSDMGVGHVEMIGQPPMSQYEPPLAPPIPQAPHQPPNIVGNTAPYHPDGTPAYAQSQPTPYVPQKETYHQFAPPPPPQPPYENQQAPRPQAIPYQPHHLQPMQPKPPQQPQQPQQHPIPVAPAGWPSASQPQGPPPPMVHQSPPAVGNSPLPPHPQSPVNNQIVIGSRPVNNPLPPPRPSNPLLPSTALSEQLEWDQEGGGKSVAHDDPFVTGGAGLVRSEDERPMHAQPILEDEQANFHRVLHGGPPLPPMARHLHRSANKASSQPHRRNRRTLNYNNSNYSIQLVPSSNTLVTIYRKKQRSFEVPQPVAQIHTDQDGYFQHTVGGDEFRSLHPYLSISHQCTPVGDLPHLQRDEQREGGVIDYYPLGQPMDEKREAVWKLVVLGMGELSAVGKGRY